MPGLSEFRNNNFDLIRLLAATQVALWHCIEIMHVDLSAFGRHLASLLHLFPGVPIFFFISGFLISRSYESNPNVAEYASNRILRLYPALICAVTLSFFLIFVSGYMQSAGASVGDWMVLFIAKTTFVQFYNPDFMRAYGDGVLNGSLWTITVELQFYILVPLLYHLIFRQAEGSNFRLLVLIVMFFLLNRLWDGVNGEFRDAIWYKLVGVSFIPWFYMFLIGVAFQRNFALFYRLLAGRFPYLLVPYLIVGLIGVHFEVNLGNNPNPLILVMLIPVIFSFSYSFPGLAKRITGGNDLSYGIYIYHMPLVNCFIYAGLFGSMVWSLSALGLTFAVAACSWFFVEKKCLALKNHPLNPLRASGTAVS